MAKVNEVTGFKIDFDIRNYQSILPSPPENIEEVINYWKPQHKCKWERQEVDASNPYHRQREVDRIMRTGVWIFIKKQMIWIPPNYYFFLQYGSAGGDYPKFRLKRLKHVYFKLEVRNNPKAIGTYTVKNRQDGETTMAMHDSLWECADGNMTIGQIGIQSKTNEDAKNPCWLSMQTLWNSLEDWVKQTLFSDFASKNAMAEKIKFERPKTDKQEARQIVIAYYPSVYNAMDGKNNMRVCNLDEINKWKECSFYDTYICCKKFLAVGSSRRGLFNIFSSPSEKNGPWNDEARMFWQKSDPNKLTEAGSTETRVYRYHSNPLDGIEGFYDEFGDCDPDEIFAFIMQERKSLPKDKLMAEIRAFPLNEQEMFESHDTNSKTWSNSEGIAERMTFLIGNRFKDDVTKEPALLFGNLQWVNNIRFNPEGVVFRQADVEDFDLVKARFAFSELPRFSDKLKWTWNSDVDGMRPVPPRLSGNVIGVDPFDKRFATQGAKGISNGSMVNVRYLDFYGTGYSRIPTGYYDCRVQHIDIFFEDMIMFAIYMRAKIQIESKNTKAIDKMQDEGMFDWLLPKKGEPEDSEIKGDAPGNGGALLNEMIALIDDVTNIPITPDSPYLMNHIWFYRLLKDIMGLDPKNTQKSNGFCAWGQAMIGVTKMLQLKPERKNINFNKRIFAYIND